MRGKIYLIQAIIALVAFGCVTVKKQKTDKLANIEIGDCTTIYERPYAYDHAIIFDEIKEKWHLIGIEYDNFSFIHLTADNLTDENWELHESFRYKEQEIWAPHIIKHENLYYMYFTTIGEPREIRYVTSKDLFNWNIPDNNLLFAYSNEYTANQKNKDTMILRDEENNRWIMYYTMKKDNEHWVIAYSTSQNLTSWEGPYICFDENDATPGVESPFVVKRDGSYYLFLSARNGWPHGDTEIFKSESPILWETKDKIKIIPDWHAAEVIQDLDGDWYISRSSGPHSDFRLAPLKWNGN